MQDGTIRNSAQEDMRKQIYIILFMLLSLSLGAKNAKVLEDTRIFKMSDLSSGTLTVVRKVEVFNKNGDREAAFMEYTDKFTSVTSFGGTVTRNGKTDKIGKKNLSSHSVASGLAEDGFVSYYVPSGPYPYVVTYNYTIRYRKGFAIFPSWYPVKLDNVSLDKGTYTIEVPPGTKVRHKCNIAGNPAVMRGTKADSYTWTLAPFKGYVIEHRMPPVSTLIPWVQASPEDFMYDGVTGCQNSWSHLGQWQADLLVGTDDLSPASEASARQMKGGTVLETVKQLYAFLGRKTRYESIQFGIGGFKPFKASLVDKVGFGDCKALSNYMHCLLRSVDVESYYTVLSTERASLDSAYASFGQTNHVMLCVPLEADTLWLECTNPSIPLGYRHSGIAGHDVLLIKDGTGEIVHVSPHKDFPGAKLLSADISISPDASARFSVHKTESLEKAEEWINFMSKRPDERAKMALSGAKVQPRDFVLDSFTDNFDTYDGTPAWYPEAQLNYSFNVGAFGVFTGNRMVLPANPFSKGITVQREKRINPVAGKRSGFYEDRIIYSIPEGYEIESLPDAVYLDTEWGKFESIVTAVPEGIMTLQSIRLHECLKSASAYDSYKDFARTVNRAYDAMIILKKIQ